MLVLKRTYISIAIVALLEVGRNRGKSSSLKPIQPNRFLLTTKKYVEQMGQVELPCF